MVLIQIVNCITHFLCGGNKNRIKKPRVSSWSSTNQLTIWRQDRIECHFRANFITYSIVIDAIDHQSHLMINSTIISITFHPTFNCSLWSLSLLAIQKSSRLRLVNMGNLTSLRAAYLPYSEFPPDRKITFRLWSMDNPLWTWGIVLLTFISSGCSWVTLKLHWGRMEEVVIA